MLIFNVWDYELADLSFDLKTKDYKKISKKNKLSRGWWNM